MQASFVNVPFLFSFFRTQAANTYIQSQQRELIGNGDDEDKYEEIEIKTDQIESGNEYVPGDQKTPQLH